MLRPYYLMLRFNGYNKNYAFLRIELSIENLSYIMSDIWQP